MTKISTNFILLVSLAISEINCGIEITEINGNKNTENFNTYTVGGILHCGVITCPTGTNCVITQERDRDLSKVLITQTCYSSDKNVVKQNRIVADAEENQGDVNIVHKKRKGWFW